VYEIVNPIALVKLNELSTYRFNPSKEALGNVKEILGKVKKSEPSLIFVDKLAVLLCEVLRLDTNLIELSKEAV